MTRRSVIPRSGGTCPPGEVRVKPGSAPPPHIHAREDEAWYILDGAVLFQLGLWRIPRGQGKSILPPRGIQHGFAVRTTEARIPRFNTLGGIEAAFRAVSGAAGSGSCDAGSEVCGPAAHGADDEFKKVRTTLKLGITTIGLLALASAGVAADTSDWANVQSLHAGDKIGIVRRNQPLVEGEVAEATATGIRMRAEGGRTIEVEKDSVLSVYRRPALSRRKRILIGVAVGAAAGAVIAVGIGNGSNGEGFFNGQTRAAAIGVSMGGGAGIGAAIGAMTGGGKKAVYERR